jgi:hypothetical protein
VSPEPKLLSPIALKRSATAQTVTRDTNAKIWCHRPPNLYQSCSPVKIDEKWVTAVFSLVSPTNPLPELLSGHGDTSDTNFCIISCENRFFKAHIPPLGFR